MPSLNRVQLIGYLGRDPETRETSSGRQVCHFNLAVDRRWTGTDGERHESTDWFNVEAWGKLGQVCQSYLSKGRLVFVEGRLNTHRYEQDGETRYYTRVIARSMQMLDRPPEEAEETAEEEDISEEE